MGTGKGTVARLRGPGFFFFPVKATAKERGCVCLYPALLGCKPSPSMPAISWVRGRARARRTRSIITVVEVRRADHGQPLWKQDDSIQSTYHSCHWHDFLPFKAGSTVARNSIKGSGFEMLQVSNCTLTRSQLENCVCGPSRRFLSCTERLALSLISSTKGVCSQTLAA